MLVKPLEVCGILSVYTLLEPIYRVRFEGASNLRVLLDAEIA